MCAREHSGSVVCRHGGIKLLCTSSVQCPSVSDIVVVWNKGSPPDPARDLHSAVPVRVRVEKLNSLNNRFNPDLLLYNRAVLSLVGAQDVAPCGRAPDSPSINTAVQRHLRCGGFLHGRKLSISAF